MLRILLASKIYDELTNNGIETILDDRDERPGVKFNDVDLIGVPIRITVGKKVENNIVELKLRTEDNSGVEHNINDIIEVVKQICSSKWRNKFKNKIPKNDKRCWN